MQPILMIISGVLLGTLITLACQVSILIAGDRREARRWGRKYPLDYRPSPQPIEPEQEEENISSPKVPITTPLEDLGVTQIEIRVPSLRTRHTMHRIRLRSMGKGTSPVLPAIQANRDTEGAIY